MSDTATAAASVTEHEGGLGPEFEAMLHRIDARNEGEAQRGLRNMELAPSLDIYRALQAGEAVPIDRLNPEAVKRYGLKTRGAA